jgi:hypothetical protein
MAAADVSGLTESAQVSVDFDALRWFELPAMTLRPMG